MFLRMNLYYIYYMRSFIRLIEVLGTYFAFGYLVRIAICRIMNLNFASEESQ